MTLLHSIDKSEIKRLPRQFTYPFYYTADPLCEVAAGVLQKQLTEWGLNRQSEGKMFGVLIVQTQKNEVGCLWGFSGNLVERLEAEYFVPPIYDLKDSTTFFAEGEKGLNEINRLIKDINQSKEYTSNKAQVTICQSEMEIDIKNRKSKIKEAKKARKEERERGARELSDGDYSELNKRLNRVSQIEKIELKKRIAEWQSRILVLESKATQIEEKILKLKEERKKRSAALQQQIFEQYQLLNAQQERKSMNQIFSEYKGITPPAGAGDCAAPRLLQYCYEQGWSAVAMAEFWWGASPNQEIRHHGQFYPSCSSKCKPILSHMLRGLDVETNPLEIQTDTIIKVVYEDDDLIVVNKPHGVLSAPGKTNQKCVSDLLHEQYPELGNLHPVHRLDMATSGLLLLAKSVSVFKLLQRQFSERKVKKRYEAIVDGEIQKDYGKIDLPLRLDLDHRPQQCVCYEHGKPALTIWKKIGVEGRRTRVAFFPITGRTHQLRVHAAHQDGLNCPIVGDVLYGRSADRLYLHASRIEFTHPVSQMKMEITAKAAFSRNQNEIL